ncbi:MAG: HAD family hydrolase [Terriglobales bacterium]|jgi:FMN phosphatase YigB (HAD superfamily)
MGDPQIVFLFDVDNTLLDNDRVTEDLRHFMEREIGVDRQQRYWEIFEKLRAELGYADYLGTLQRYRAEYPHNASILKVSLYLVDYPFANRLFPNSLDAVEHVKQWGTAAILSDGDAVFQPRKIECSGLMDAVDRNIRIYVHKETELADVEKKLPAEHYVVIDDKLRLLTAIKEQWKDRVTTIFVNQGHYARDPKNLATYPAADLSIDRIGDMLKLAIADFLPAAKRLSAG